MADYSKRENLYQLWVLLRRVSHQMSNTRTRELSRYGVSVAEAAALAVVHAMEGKATPAEIARQILRQPHTVSRLVSRLYNKGLVNKVQDAQRKNIVRVSLTDKGRQMFSRAMEIESIRDILSVLSDEEQRQLYALLLKLRRKTIERLAKTRRPLFATDESGLPLVFK